MAANSVEEAIYDYITADTAFMANIKRLDLLETPDGTAMPYVNFWLVSDPGIKTELGYIRQGEARFQFDLWDSNNIRGTKIRRLLKELVEEMNGVKSGYHLMTTGTTEQTIPRTSGTDPFHYVVDGIVRWRKE